MISLSDLKAKYVQELQGELSLIERPAVGLGLAGGRVNVQENLGDFSKSIEDSVTRTNRGFIQEINGELYESSFSDDERSLCYEEFRNECSKVVSEFTKTALSPKRLSGE